MCMAVIGCVVVPFSQDSAALVTQRTTCNQICWEIQLQSPAYSKLSSVQTVLYSQCPIIIGVTNIGIHLNLGEATLKAATKHLAC
jgi:hypothetical protein